MFTYTLFFPHEYIVFTGSKISYSKISDDWKRKLGYNEGKQLYNHRSNSKIYSEHYNNYVFIYLPTSTKCNLNPIQTNHPIDCTTQPSASYDLIFLSSCNIIITCSKFTVTNISGFSTCSQIKGTDKKLFDHLISTLRRKKYC